jgi:hypothetical protein
MNTDDLSSKSINGLRGNVHTGCLHLGFPALRVALGERLPRWMMPRGWPLHFGNPSP